MTRVPSGPLPTSARQLTLSSSASHVGAPGSVPLTRSPSGPGLQPSVSGSLSPFSPDHPIHPQQLPFGMMDRPLSARAPSEHDFNADPATYPSGAPTADPGEYLPSYSERRRNRLQRQSSSPQFTEGIPAPQPHPHSHPHALLHSPSAPQLPHNTSAPHLFPHGPNSKPPIIRQSALQHSRPPRPPMADPNSPLS